MEIHFLSYFPVFITKYTHYFSNITKHLKGKLKEIWISNAYKKIKELIHFPFFFVNQTRLESTLPIFIPRC